MVDAELCKCWHTYVRKNIVNTPVYKDQCSKSYRTPKSEGGLNVCLNTLEGFSCDPVMNWTEHHY